MTIARRILLLVGLAPLILAALGVLTHAELARIESRSRFVAETQVPSLSSLGNISRAFEEMRVDLRDHLLAPDAAGRAKARQAFDARRDELDQLLRSYADTLVSDDRDRRSLDEFRVQDAEWVSAATEVMALADGGRREESAAAAGQRPRGRLGRACRRCPPRVDRAQPGPGRERRRHRDRQPRGRAASHLRRSGARAAPVGRSRPADLPEDRRARSARSRPRWSRSWAATSARRCPSPRRWTRPGRWRGRSTS